MELVFFFVILAVLIGGFMTLSVKLGKPELEQKDNTAILMLQKQMNDVMRTMDVKLSESAKAMREQFGESAKIIRDITQELVKVGEGQKQVMNVTDQLRSLQDILKNPKQRGVLGEYYLETVLQNVMPPGTYQIQYPFNDGTIVDAAVIVGDRVIPVDSKFSLENYNRMLEAQSAESREHYAKAFVGDIKIRIDETSKYIKPEEGTMEFTFMFIPSEAVYYDILINKVGTANEDANNLITYAWRKGVIIVSPMSFLAYLQTVLQGLKALQIEESAKEIRKRVEELGRHLGSFESYMKKLGAHLGTSVGMFNSAYKELGKIDKDVLRVSGVSADIDVMTLERPEEERKE